MFIGSNSSAEFAISNSFTHGVSAGAAGSSGLSSGASGGGSAPSWASSSMAIEADGPPMPVEVTRTGVAPRYAIHVRYSRLLASSRGRSKGAVRASASTRPGSPGSSAIAAPSMTSESMFR